MALYSYAIGTIASGSAGVTNVESLTTPLAAPKSTFIPYSKEIPLGDGIVLGGGWISATWHWDIMSKNQRDQLKQFCSGLSGEVYITTRKQDLTYGTYKAVMVWVSEEERDAERVLDLTIKFHRMELQ